MAEPVRVALVGYGLAGKVFHAPLISSVDGLELAAVVSSRADEVRADWPQVAVVSSLQAALADPSIELVVIATPNALHAPQAIDALSAGRHVVIDKPFAVTSAEARAVIEVAARHDKLLSVFHNRRWDADFRTLAALMRDGTLGEIVQFESHFDRFRLEVRDRWRERAEPGAGLWYDLGPHLVDQALQLFGAPLEITADIAPLRPGAVADDYFHVVMRYARLRVILHASTMVAAHGLRFAVHGTHGSWIKHGLDPQEAALKAGGRPSASDWGHDPEPGVLTAAPGAPPLAAPPAPLNGDYAAFYRDMAAAIRGRGALPVAAADALRVLEVLECAVAASQARQSLALAPDPAG
jgi:predicted dehydrogenase